MRVVLTVGLPPRVGFAGWLFGGMDGKPLLGGLFIKLIFRKNLA